MHLYVIFPHTHMNTRIQYAFISTPVHLSLESDWGKRKLSSCHLPVWVKSGVKAKGKFYHFPQTSMASMSAWLYGCLSRGYLFSIFLFGIQMVMWLWLFGSTFFVCEIKISFRFAVSPTAAKQKLRTCFIFLLLPISSIHIYSGVYAWQETHSTCVTKIEELIDIRDLRTSAKGRTYEIVVLSQLALTAAFLPASQARKQTGCCYVRHMQFR